MAWRRAGNLRRHTAELDLQPAAGERLSIGCVQRRRLALANQSKLSKLEEFE
jgi:hypothetical protein